MMRRIPLLIPLLAVSGAAAGCGGGGSTATVGASAAELVPASAPIFLALNTDLSSKQIKSGDAVLKKFPVRDQVLDGIRSAIAGSGIDVGTLRRAAGPEIDIAVLDLDREFSVGFTQPRDEKDRKSTRLNSSHVAIS